MAHFQGSLLGVTWPQLTATQDFMASTPESPLLCLEQRGLSRAPHISFALIILMFPMRRPWCYCPCFTDGRQSREFKPCVQVSPRYSVAERASSSGASWVHGRCHCSVSGAENPSLTATNRSSEVWGLVEFSQNCAYFYLMKSSLLRLSG